MAPASGMTSVEMNAIPNEVAFAGTDQALCNTTVATLAAQAPSLGTGRWRQSVGPPANIVNPEEPNAVEDGLQSGES